MVPGKHDFYYGPGGLRALAQYLHGAKSTSILGSNLFVVTHTARPDPNPPPTAAVGPKSQAKLVLPSTVLPWLHQIELQTAGPADFSEVWTASPSPTVKLLRTPRGKPAFASGGWQRERFPARFRRTARPYSGALIELQPCRRTIRTQRLRPHHGQRSHRGITISISRSIKRAAGSSGTARALSTSSLQCCKDWRTVFK